MRTQCGLYRCLYLLHIQLYYLRVILIFYQRTMITDHFKAMLVDQTTVPYDLEGHKWECYL